MNWPKKRIIAASLIACTVFVSCAWHAKHTRFTHGKMAQLMEKHLADVLEELDTTPDQKRRIAEITEGLKADAAKLRKASRGEHRVMFDEIMTGKADAAKLHADLDKTLDRLGRFSHETLDRLIRFSQILSPNQRAELKRRFEAAHGAATNPS